MTVLAYFTNSWYFGVVETGVTTVTVQVCADSTAILSEWHELADRVGTVFSSRPGFVLNVVEATALECVFVVVRRGGRLVALAPLSLVRRGPLTLAKVVGTNLGVPLEFLSEDDEASDALLAAIAAQGYMLSADSLIAGEQTVQRLTEHPSWLVHSPVRERIPVIALKAGQTAAAIRGAKSLKRLRQYRKSAESFAIEVVDSVDQLEKRWQDILRVAADAISGTSKVNYLVSPDGEFAKDFLLHEARNGRLCIAGVVIDGVWRAHEIGIRTGSRMEGWLTHYDPAIAKWQPGHQLIEWFANNHDGLGVNELDQGVGVNQIKTTWTTAGYEVLRVSAVPRSWVLSGLLIQVLRRLPPVLSCLRKSTRAAMAALGVRR